MLSKVKGSPKGLSRLRRVVAQSGLGWPLLPRRNRDGTLRTAAVVSVGVAKPKRAPSTSIFPADKEQPRHQQQEPGHRACQRSPLLPPPGTSPTLGSQEGGPQAQASGCLTMAVKRPHKATRQCLPS